ncbi:MAG: hypothetical protein AAB851_02570, partial [Patescibacteria group bacterium]
TELATNITLTSATLNGTVNPKGESVYYQFFYRKESELASSTQKTSYIFAGSGTSDVSVNTQISGLSPGTQYIYWIYTYSYATNTIVRGGQRSFITAISKSSSSNSSTASSKSSSSSSSSQLFTSYNDLSWSAGQANTNITLYTTGQNGLLKDYFTGANTPVTLTIAGGDISHSNYLIQGSNANSGTDAYTVFNGIVNSAGLISYSATNLTFTLTGLDPNLNYEFVLFGNRNNTSYTNRTTTTTISDVMSFTNASTPGATFSGANDSAATITNGYNTVNGYIARFTNIKPGADGDMLITVSSPTGQFYANALMLRATQSSGSSSSSSLSSLSSSASS